MAGVGKHAEKLAYEFAFSDDESAPVYTSCSFVARGPGIAGTGTSGAGEGDADPRRSLIVGLL